MRHITLYASGKLEQTETEALMKKPISTGKTKFMGLRMIREIEQQD